ncbi:MAG: hypothetical protein AABX85_00235 [Nanoarchaeota archaeon]
METKLFRTRKRGNNYFSVWTIRSLSPGKILRNVESLLGNQNRVYVGRDSDGSESVEVYNLFNEKGCFSENVIIGVMYDVKDWRKNGAIVEAKVVSPHADSELVKKINVALDV